MTGVQPQIESYTNLYGCISPPFDFVARVNQCLDSCGIDMGPDEDCYESAMLKCEVRLTLQRNRG